MAHRFYLAMIRRAIMHAVNVPVGTIPVYQDAEEMLAKGKVIIEMSEEKVWRAVGKRFRDA